MDLCTFYKIVGDRPTEIVKFMWDCYGSSAVIASCDTDAFTVTAIHDPTRNIVCEFSVCDYVNNRAYRWFDPAVESLYRREATERGISDFAWDNIPFIDLENFQDFQEKATAIVAGEPYDPRVQIEIELEDHLLFELMVQAHKKDVTTNQLVNQLLRKYLQLGEKV